MNEKSKVDSDSDSDSDTYVDLNDIMANKLRNIYQIQITDSNVQIKHVGVGSDVPDMIIKNNFGKNENLHLYNCVYKQDEIDFLTKEIHLDKFLPIVKLIENLPDQTNIYTLSVKISELVKYNEDLHLWDLYLTLTRDNYVEFVPIEKNINSTNIIESFLSEIIEFGIKIL
jgi:hypothetical protein